PAAHERLGLQMADSVLGGGEPETFDLGPFRPARLAIDGRRVRLVDSTLLVLLPMHMGEKVQRLPVAAMRTRDKGLALISFEEGGVDARGLLGGRRARADVKRGMDESGRPLLGEQHRVAFLRGLVLVNL